MDEIMTSSHKQNDDTKFPMKDLVKISLEIAIGVRQSMSKHSIRQIADFVNGIAFAGLLLQKNYRPEEGERSFVATFERGLESYADLLSADEYAGYRKELMVHEIGITDQTPTQMLVVAGLSAEGTISEIAGDFNLSAQDVMEVVTIIIALAVTASTPKDKRDIVLTGIKQGVVEKSCVWDQMVPSDDEMFGDFDI